MTNVEGLRLGRGLLEEELRGGWNFGIVEEIRIMNYTSKVI